MCIQTRQKKKKRYENPIRELCEMFQLLQSICTESRHEAPHCRLTFHFWVNLRCVQPGEKSRETRKRWGFWAVRASTLGVEKVHFRCYIGYYFIHAEKPTLSAVAISAYDHWLLFPYYLLNRLIWSK